MLAQWKSTTRREIRSSISKSGPNFSAAILGKSRSLDGNDWVADCLWVAFLIVSSSGFEAMAWNRRDHG
jgi:hypothetical protein